MTTNLVGNHLYDFIIYDENGEECQRLAIESMFGGEMHGDYFNDTLTLFFPVETIFLVIPLNRDKTSMAQHQYSIYKNSVITIIASNKIWLLGSIRRYQNNRQTFDETVIYDLE